MRTLLTTHSLTCVVNEITLFENLTLTIGEVEHVALVGKNGSGKSTLLKILAGVLPPSTGSVQSTARRYYMPQIDLALLQEEGTVQEYCTQNSTEWQKVKIELHKFFSDQHISENREVHTLSGGELMMLNLSIGLVTKPDILFLDEPTNHLDIAALATLDTFLARYKGALVVVSHDPLFLDRVATKVWAIADGKLEAFGGAYSQYRDDIEQREVARLRQLEAAQKSMRKAERSREAEKKRTARSVRDGKQEKSNISFDGFAFGFHKNKSENAAGKQKVKLDERVTERAGEVERLKRPATRRVSMPLTEADEGRRTVVFVTDAVLSVGERVLIKDIHLALRYGERIALVGKNGSGKSALLQALLGLGGSQITGDVRVGARSVVYVDQKYRNIDPTKTLLQNVEDTNPFLSMQDARDQLARFMFTTTESVKKLAGVLSGGEAARLTLAMVTAQPLDLLILDEPTNNLDIETLDTIAEGFAAFSGALIVISHNVHFLERLKIERSYIISDSSLKLLMTTPELPQDFYSAILKRM